MWMQIGLDPWQTKGQPLVIGPSLYLGKVRNKQTITAKSSVEAECGAVGHGCCEWTLFCDCESAIKLAKNPVCHERTKHVEVDCHFIKEKIEGKDVVLVYTNTTNQIADFLTKDVNKNKLWFVQAGHNKYSSTSLMGSIVSSAIFLYFGVSL